MGAQVSDLPSSCPDLFRAHLPVSLPQRISKGAWGTWAGHSHSTSLTVQEVKASAAVWFSNNEPGVASALPPSPQHLRERSVDACCLAFLTPRAGGGVPAVEPVRSSPGPEGHAPL